MTPLRVVPESTGYAYAQGAMQRTASLRYVLEHAEGNGWFAGFDKLDHGRQARFVPDRGRALEMLNAEATRTQRRLEAEYGCHTWAIEVKS